MWRKILQEQNWLEKTGGKALQPLSRTERGPYEAGDNRGEAVGIKGKHTRGNY